MESSSAVALKYSSVSWPESRSEGLILWVAGVDNDNWENLFFSVMQQNTGVLFLTTPYSRP